MWRDLTRVQVRQPQKIRSLTISRIVASGSVAGSMSSTFLMLNRLLMKVSDPRMPHCSAYAFLWIKSQGLRRGVSAACYRSSTNKLERQPDTQIIIDLLAARSCCVRMLSR